MRLVAFDFDDTLATGEMTILLGERSNAADEIARVTEQAMAGEIDYEQSVRDRVAALEGLTIDEMEAAFSKVELRPGAAALLEALDEAGIIIAILTGGFRRGVDMALEQAGVSVDVVIANELGIDSGRLTGEVTGPLVQGDKGPTFRQIAVDHSIRLEETVAVGDGANDLEMLEIAGLAIGMDPKPIVRPACDLVVYSMDELMGVFRERKLLP